MSAILSLNNSKTELISNFSRKLKQNLLSKNKIGWSRIFRSYLNLKDIKEKYSNEAYNNQDILLNLSVWEKIRGPDIVNLF